MKSGVLFGSRFGRLNLLDPGPGKCEEPMVEGRQWLEEKMQSKMYIVVRETREKEIGMVRLASNITILRRCTRDENALSSNSQRIYCLPNNESLRTNI